MEGKSIISWKDVIKLALGIAIGLVITIGTIWGISMCNHEVNNGPNRNETWQNKIDSSDSREKLVVSGIVADDYTGFANDSIGIFKKDGKYGYYNAKAKEIVIPAMYENAWRFSEGLAGVIKDGQLGFINRIGETVFGFNHAYYKGKLHEFVFHWGYCVVLDGKGKCGVVDKTGKWVIQPLYEKVALVCPEYAIVSVRNGYNMQVDYNGNILNPYVVDEVERLLYTKYERDNPDDDYKEYPTSFYKYRVNGNAGLMNEEGHFVTKPIFNNVEAIDEELFLGTLKDGMSNVMIDGKGNVVNR